MKQCKDCKTYKKADNCIECYQKTKGKLDDISVIIHAQLREYQKLEKIQEVIDTGRLERDRANQEAKECIK